MLRLHQKQFEIFEKQAADRFVKATVEFLLSEHADAVEHLTAQELTAQAGHALARARGLGMRTDVALQGFTALMFEFGPQFDRHPAVRRVLGDTTIPPDYFLDALVQELPRRVWDELAILASDEGWPGQAHGNGAGA